MKVKVINKSKFNLPEYKTIGSAGVDLVANVEGEISLWHEERVTIPTGLYVELPVGYELQIRPRSGLAAKYGITVLNAPGTIDSDYRGEIGVILFNTSREPFVIKPGDRIAQAVLSKYEKIDWEEAESLDDTDRGEGGFGHTGI